MGDEDQGVEPVTRFLTLLLAVGCSFAAVTNVRVLGTTATQAAVAYTAPDGSACSLAVSQAADVNGNPLPPLVHDVDTSLFPGADQDSRAGSVALGRSRLFVIGKRAAEKGPDGRYYSRALETNSPHYGKITCGGDTALFTFQTANIPLGIGYGDPWPADSANPGAWAIPSSPGKETFIDPQTGARVQRLAAPGFGYGGYTAALNTAYNQGQNPCDTAGPWVTPCNAAGSSGYASEGNSTAWLAVRSNNIGWSSWQGPDLTDPTYGPYLQQVQVSLKGHCSSSNAALCQIDVCLSMTAGAACANAPQSVTLPYSTDGTVTAGTYNPGAAGIDSWLYGSNPGIMRAAASTHTGNVTVSGTTVTRASGNWFDPAWVGGRVRLSNTSTSDACNAASGTSIEAAIASVGGNTLTLTTSPGSYTYYCVSPFAVMVRRHTPDASSSVYVQNAAVNFVIATAVEFPSAGFENICSKNLVNGGYLCTIPTGGGGGALAWINPADGTTNMIGPLSANRKTTGANQWNYASGNMPCPLLSPDVFSTIDDTLSTPTWLCSAFDTNNNPIVLQIQYTGSYSTSSNYPQSAAMGQGSLTASDDYSLTYANGVTITDLTPASLGKDLGSLMQAYLNTNFPGQQVDPYAGQSGDTPAVSCWNIGPVQQGNLLVNCFRGHDTMGWLFVFSPGDRNPTHAGQPGGPNVIAAMNTWNSGASRFSVDHSVQDYGQSGYFGYGPDPLFPANHALGNTAVIVTTNSSVSGASDCSTWGNPLGITGANCIQLQINANGGSYEPYFQTAVPPQPSTPGIPATAQPGDLVCVTETSADCNWLNLSKEYMMLLQKGVSGDSSQWVFRRGPYKQTFADGNLKYLYFMPSSIANAAGVPAWGNMYTEYPGYIPSPIYGNNIMWDYRNDPNGQAAFMDPKGVGGHGFSRPTQFVVATTEPFSPWAGIYNMRHASDFPSLASAHIDLATATPSFNGLAGAAAPNVYQSHPGPSGDVVAGAYEGQAAFDVRPLIGTGTSSPGAPSAFTLVSGQLWVSSPTVTDADNTNLLNRKVYATAASSGPHPLLDVSGPNSSISDQPADSYKYCAVRIAGECRSGSSVGQVYVNAPAVIYPWCYGDNVSGTQNPQVNDICISNATPLGQATLQMSTWQTDMVGAFQRVITRAMTGVVKYTIGLASTHALPDNSWILFKGDYLDGLTRNVYMAKLPPFPPADSEGRAAFVAVPVDLTPPAGMSVNNAIVEFGYQEFNGNCTTRSETCIANSATAPSGRTPFAFAGESPAGLACAAGCTITIPAISQRMLYYRVKYRDSSNNVLAMTPSQVLAVP